MRYQGKAIELISTKKVFGREVAWIKFLEDNSFNQVDLEDIDREEVKFSLPLIGFVALAAKIKDEISRKKILAPYESSLIPLPHQILVLEKVMQSPHNRFLLADEVGMGKTIETGLILKELKLRGDISRILVITPKSSILQWQSELKEHFNEVFHIYDSETITSFARTLSNITADRELNFWEQHNQIIVSTDALKPIEMRQGWSEERVEEYNKYRMEAVLDANFDLVIIDEAHKMGGASQTVSRYILAQALCNSVANVLLLTATPHRGKADHFRRILQLLDPDAFQGEGLPDLRELEPYVIRTEKRLAVDYEGKKLFSERETVRFDVFLDPHKHLRQIALYEAVTNYVRKGFKTAKNSGNSATGLIMVLFQRLVSSSTAAILSAMEGRLQRLKAGETDESEYLESLDENADSYNENFEFDHLYASNEEGIDNEELVLSALIDQAKDCINNETDVKAEALLKKYQDLQEESQDFNLKIIVFTEFRTTQKMLTSYFSSKGYSCEKINGSQELDERRKALVNFKDKAQILVATDAAGESLNMQFCHIVFNYDLPWNPMMIEQRIGRVDRIGQKKKVKAFNMLTNNTVDLRVYEVIEEKLNSILEQLGIDKTSDVLDSAMDQKKVNTLYLQSLLDPEKFDFFGEKWLNEIRSKLKDFQSTEGILPEVREEEINYKKAAEIKHSPLPIWLEKLINTDFLIKGQDPQKISQSTYSIRQGENKKKYSFDPETVVNDPGIEQITLQHPWVKRILNELETFNTTGGLPVLKSAEEYDINGVWSLWEITAKNQFEEKKNYHAYFIADNGKQYSAYANDIWQRLTDGDPSLKFGGSDTEHSFSITEQQLEEYLFSTYKNLEIEVNSVLKTKKENKQKSYDFQRSRINKIGIENIRTSKLNKLDKEHREWLKEFNAGHRTLPHLKNLLSLRINV